MVENVGRHHRQCLIYLLCGVAAFISIGAILTHAGYLHVLGNYSFYIGIIFPMLFEIKRKEWRNPIIAIVIVALILRRGWIGLGCVAITYFILFWKSHRMAIIIALALILTVVPLIGAKNRCSVFHDLYGRIGYYRQAVELWKHPAFGEGFHSYQKIPENQYDKTKGKLWVKWTHSDYIQGLYELGMVRMVFAIFLALIPLGYAKLEDQTDRVIFAGYLCVLLNAVFDFPFHRPISAVIGIAVLFLQFTNLKTRSKNELESEATIYSEEEMKALRNKGFI